MRETLACACATGRFRRDDRVGERRDSRTWIEWNAQAALTGSASILGVVVLYQHFPHQVSSRWLSGPFLAVRTRVTGAAYLSALS